MDMNSIVLTPQLYNRQFTFNLPEVLDEQDIEIRIIIHYLPSKIKNVNKKSDDIKELAGIFKNADYQPLKMEWYEQ